MYFNVFICIIFIYHTADGIVKEVKDKTSYQHRQRNKIPHQPTNRHQTQISTLYHNQKIYTSHIRK
jgi:hypothetical protein